MDEDKLERFIRENRAEMDEFKARPGLWEAIEAELEPETKVRPLWNRTWLRVAAGLLLPALIGLGWWMGASYSGPASGTLAHGETQFLPAEEAEAQAVLTMQVSLLRQELIDNPAINANDKAAVLNMLDQLDKEYERLKLDLLENAANREVLENMIRNQRSRLNLLEEVLDQVKGLNNGMNPVNNENHETTNL